MRFVTTDAAISRWREAAARLPASATVTKVLRFSMPSMILRDTRIVTALYGGFSSMLRVTTLVAPTAQVNLAFGDLTVATGQAVLRNATVYVGNGDVSSHLPREQS